MTKYEYLFNRIEEAKDLQLKFFSDEKLYKFYSNVVVGFEKRLAALTVAEASEEV